jgi:hypothetical protein
MDDDALDYLVSLLQREAINNVLVTGYIDRSERVHQFRPVPDTVYLELGHGFLRMDAIGQYDQLKLSHVDEIVLEDILVDDDDDPAVGSYAQMLLTFGSTEPRCTGLRYWTDERSDPVAGVVKCLEVEVDGVDIIFADPTWHFGIHLGTAERRRKWQRDYFDEAKGMREFSWRP